MLSDVDERLRAHTRDKFTHRNKRLPPGNLHARTRRQFQIVLLHRRLRFAMRMTRRSCFFGNLRQATGETLPICQRQCYRQQNENSDQRAPHAPSD